MSAAEPLSWLLRTASAAPADGVLRAGVELPRVDLEAMRREGFVVHVAGPVYLPQDLAGIRAARVAALRTLVPAGRVVGLLAAAWAHGVDVSPEPVEVLVDRAPHVGRGVDGVRERESPARACDVVRVGGVLLTTPARTAADVARWLPGDVARPVVAALLAAGTSHDEVLAVLRRGRYRNAVRGRQLVLELTSGA